VAVVAPESPSRKPRVRRRLPIRLGSRSVRRRRGRPLRHLGQEIGLLGAMLAVVVAPGGIIPGQIGRVLLVVVATAYAMLADRRGDLRQRAALALGVGTVGTTIGHGIGFTHAAQEGISVRATAGLCAMLLGIAVLLTGLIALLRTLPARSRLLVLAVAPFSFVFVLAPVATAIAVSNPPPSPVGTATPGDRGFPYEDVELVTSDGLRLSGWYIPSRNTAAVAMVHDAGASRWSLLSQAVLLARQGYGVLLFDTRGNGISDGDAMDLGWYGGRDVAAAVSYLAERYDVDRTKIGLVGVGRGGDAALEVTGTDDRVRSVVAEGPGRRTPFDAFTLIGEPLRWPQAFAETVEFTTAGFLRQGLPPGSLRSSVLDVAPRSALLVGEMDSIGAARMYQRASPGNVSLWELPTIPEGRAWDLRSAIWEEKVTEFLHRTLAPKPVQRQ
jgi:uncharacterized protein